jgi:hypothetical protein
MKLLETTLSGGSDYASNDAAGAPITVTVKPNQPHVISSGKLKPKECKSRLLSQVKNPGQYYFRLPEFSGCKTRIMRGKVSGTQGDILTWSGKKITQLPCF